MTTNPSNRNTGNTGIEHVTDHNNLHLAFNTQRISIPASHAYASGGATLANNDSISFPDAGIPVGTVAYSFPADWATIHVDLLYIPLGTGNVRLGINRQFLSDGVAIPGFTAITSATYPAVSGQFQVARLTTGFALSGTAHTHTVFQYYRDAAHGTDTVAAAISTYGIIITKAS
jgi:hypothetical protein